ncbi:helix-turn-helix domain-containing protein [Paenibacillus nasutitermitis]|uniref:AraC family transcriptional regulator n=1 Tax=Paenibacillus nasutitermitis TaxID=1652958 RepID=A0A916Z8Z3_9BACL|nr:helix-turn-helix domain-containing protein [Paenibacillus nasutitermitis]GGD80573.1 AraC family transcriptional regulator [Paenibacillus nasutitermitis]
MAENLEDSADNAYLLHPHSILAGDFEQLDDYKVRRPQGTRDWLLTLTYGGRGSFGFGQERHACEDGDLVLIRPGVPHDYETTAGEKWQFVWAHFLPDPEWMDLLQLPDKKGDLLMLSIEQPVIRERLLTAFRRMVRDSIQGDLQQQRLAKNALEEVVLLIGRYARQFEGGAMDARIRQTLDYLGEHFREPHTIASLAGRVALSSSRFAHLFKQETGDSVIETLLKMRLSYAARLLERTSLSIAQVAEDVGFSDSFYFTKQFTALYGQNPSAYRKSIDYGPSPERSILLNE